MEIKYDDVGIKIVDVKEYCLNYVNFSFWFAVWGVCSHCFHMHCIMKWLAAQQNQICPMCRQDWALKSE